MSIIRYANNTPEASRLVRPIVCCIIGKFPRLRAQTTQNVLYVAEVSKPTALLAGAMQAQLDILQSSAAQKSDRGRPILANGAFIDHAL